MATEVITACPSAGPESKPLPALSVIVPTRDRPDDLASTVASLLAQTRLPRELLIVDQSAGKESRRRIEELFARAPEIVRSSVTLRYFHEPRIGGLPAARNFAMRKASGDIWWFLDDDVHLERDHAQRLLEVYGNDESVTGVSGVITNYPPPSAAFRLWRRVFERGPFRDARQPLYWRAHQARDTTPVVVDKLGGGLMSFRASALRGYRCDESRGGCPRGEDIDFCAGLGPDVKLVITPRARMEHRQTPVARPTADWVAEEMEGARRLYRRHWSGNKRNALCLLWLALGYRLLAAYAGLKPVVHWAGRRWPWLAVAALATWLYQPVMAGLIRQWWQDPNYSHGFLIPVVSAWLIWNSRARWRRLPIQPANLAALGLVLALAMLIAGTLGAELFISRISMLLLLTCAIAFVAGWRWLRAWAFPLSFLLFMVPLPAIIYYQITFPLQLLASRLAGFSLDLLQIPALREGNVIQLPNYAMSVAEACSGIRSLFSLLALAVAYGYFREARVWKRIALALLMIPIAIASNAFRIVGTGIVTFFFGPRYAEGFFHAFSGWLIFIVAFGLMLLAHRMLCGRGGHRAVKARRQAPMAPAWAEEKRSW